MTNLNKDLWPDFDLKEDENEPLIILKNQARNLANKTNRLVHGEVLTNSNEEYISHTFYLVSPNLDNYRYSLLEINHKAISYPVIIINNNIRKTNLLKFDKKIEIKDLFNEISNNLPKINLKDILNKNESGYISANTSEELILELGKIFNSLETKNIIKSLINQSISIKAV